MKAKNYCCLVELSFHFKENYVMSITVEALRILLLSHALQTAWGAKFHIRWSYYQAEYTYETHQPQSKPTVQYKASHN